MHKNLINELLTRQTDTNKYDYGHVLIVGGAPGMVGAPLLSAIATLRIGAGLVTIASNDEVIDKLEKRVLEVMTLRLPEELIAATKVLTDFITQRKVSVVVFGPGMSSSLGNLVKEITPKLSIPIILDAGAITTFENDLTSLLKLTKHNEQIVITPHDGEYKKLTGSEMPQDFSRRKDVAISFSKIYRLTLVSKGSHTLIANNEGKFYENNSGNAGMATAGTGDVLDGIIAGLIAQKFSIFEACTLGTYLHGLAGDLAATYKTQAAMIASDIIEYLPQALKEAE